MIAAHITGFSKEEGRCKVSCALFGSVVLMGYVIGDSDLDFMPISSIIFENLINGIV